MVSRGLLQVGGILLLSLAVSATASAQYGGGGSGSSGMGGSGSSSTAYGPGGYGGNGKAIGIGVGAAAAAAVGVVLFLHHRHTKAEAAEAKAADTKASLIGCTHSEINGISLKNENDEQTYMIISSGSQLQVGQRVELTGLVTDQGPGTRTFRVQGPIRSFGTCDATAAALAPKATAQAN